MLKIQNWDFFGGECLLHLSLDSNAFLPSSTTVLARMMETVVQHILRMTVGGGGRQMGVLDFKLSFSDLYFHTAVDDKHYSQHITLEIQRFQHFLSLPSSLCDLQTLPLFLHLF